MFLIYNRKGLTRLVKGRRYARHRREEFGAWVSSLADFADEYVPADQDGRLPAKRRRLATAVRARDVGRAATAAGASLADRLAGRRARGDARRERAQRRRPSSAQPFGYAPRRRRLGP